MHEYQKQKHQLHLKMDQQTMIRDNLPGMNSQILQVLPGDKDLEVQFRASMEQFVAGMNTLGEQILDKQSHMRTLGTFNEHTFYLSHTKRCIQQVTDKEAWLASRYPIDLAGLQSSLEFVGTISDDRIAAQYDARPATWGCNQVLYTLFQKEPDAQDYLVKKNERSHGFAAADSARDFCVGVF